MKKFLMILILLVSIFMWGCAGKTPAPSPQEQDADHLEETIRNNGGEIIQTMIIEKEGKEIKNG